jgi:hypothetical protein
VNKKVWTLYLQFEALVALTINYCTYIDTEAKCRHLKTLACKWNLQQVFIFLRPLPILDFCLGWCSNFVGSESSQVRSVKLFALIYLIDPCLVGTDLMTGATSMLRERLALISPYLLFTTHLYRPAFSGAGSWPIELRFSVRRRILTNRNKV